MKLVLSCVVLQGPVRSGLFAFLGRTEDRDRDWTMFAQGGPDQDRSPVPVLKAVLDRSLALQDTSSICYQGQ